MLTDKLIQESIERAKIENESARKKDVSKRVSFYRDDFKTIITDEVNRQFHKDIAPLLIQLVDDSVNIVKRIVNEISIVYKVAARRDAVLSEGVVAREERKVDARYAELQSRFDFDIFMDQVNKYTNLCNEAVVRVSPDFEKKCVQLDLLTPDIVSVSQSRSNPSRYDRLTYSVTFVDTPANKEIQYIYWDKFGKHLVVDQDFKDITKNVNPENKEPGVNPYKDKLPFYITHRQIPMGSIWDSTSGNDLLSAAIQAGVNLTALNYLFKRNSYKQLKIKGIEKKDLPLEIITDPAYPLVLNGVDVDADVLDFQIDIAKLMGFVKDKILLVCNNYGISAEMLQSSISSSSGYALRIKKEALLEKRQEQIKYYRSYEAEIFEIVRMVNNTYFPNDKISDTAVFNVDFGEISIPDDPATEREKWKFDFQTGAADIVDYVMSRNPDLTRDEAVKKIDANLAMNKKMGGSGIDFDALFGNKKEAPPDASL